MKILKPEDYKSMDEYMQAVARDALFSDFVSIFCVVSTALMIIAMADMVFQFGIF